MRLVRLLLSPLLAALASACDNVVKITHQGHALPYTPSLIIELVQHGELPLRLHGQPFAATTGDDEIAAAIRPPAWLPSTVRLTTQPTTVRQNFAVVLTFNPPYRHPDMEAACAPGATPRAGEPGDGRTLRVAANVCYEGRSISWLYAEAPAPKSLDDPNFRKLTDQIMIGLFPQQPRYN